MDISLDRLLITYVNIVMLFRPSTRKVKLYLFYLGTESPSLCDEAASIDFDLSRSEWYRDRSSNRLSANAEEMPEFW